MKNDYYIKNDTGDHTFILPSIKIFTEKHLYIRGEGSNVIVIQSNSRKLCFRYEDRNEESGYRYETKEIEEYEGYGYELPNNGIYELILTYYPHEEGVWIARITRLTDRFW